MPATRHSVLDAPGDPVTDLRPGETGIRLKDDPFYGKVDLGAAPKPDKKAGSKPGTALGARDITNEKVVALQEKIDEGAHALDGEEQDHVEVLTGKRLQQRAPEDPRPPEEVDPSEPTAKASAEKPKVAAKPAAAPAS